MIDLKRRRWLYVNMGVSLGMIIVGVALLVTLQLTPTYTTQAENIPTAVLLNAEMQPAADFELPNLAGDSTALSDFAGQVVLINLWATWCPPCRAEMPTLDAYYQANKDKGFVVLAVNSEESIATAREFIEANGFSFPVVVDQHGSLYEDYHIPGLPTSFVVDRDGMVRAIHTGALTERQVAALVEPFL